MSTVRYTLVRDEKGQSLTVYVDHDGEFETHVLSSDHANFKTVRDYLLDLDDSGEVDEADVAWLKSQVDVLLAVGSRLESLSERVRVTETALTFDGDPINGALVDHIIRLVREGDKARYAPLVAFLEKLYTNPSVDSIDSLYSWLVGKEFTIMPDGDFVAYKGVKVIDGESHSINSGRAIVDGVVHKGNIPNHKGSVIEMPRSEVESKTHIGCASGLHAGNWRYAAAFGQGRVLMVKINPRDVVSVPTDSNFEKLRVSRYTVLDSIEQEYTKPTYSSWDGEEDEDDDEDYDEYYDDGWGDGDGDVDDEPWDEFGPF